ncbi:MAG: protease modulator HflC [Candidatus Caldatribacteriota bacterium]|nr:protease modulator HflC [Atribacterota bacterium]MDD3031411.1 protease modulator HflC [Atribacterota bacterium]MDD3640524.1 protease modulator HflC [Atribacterota bacterium]MDD4288003.1 protease modulator HflC [Atribacterota bacterium]MDD4764631.1 protease modulator HflC [Atribacterota bacterium]
MRKSLLIIILVLVIIVANFSFFIVDETKQAIILQFGKPIKAIQQAGLYMKIPFIQNVVLFEGRLLIYDAQPTEIITRDKKTLILDNYARWKIEDPLLFLQTVRDINGAQARLDDIIYSELRVDLGKFDMSEIVSQKRTEIMKTVTERSNEKSIEYGINIIDVRIKRADLPPENEQNIFARMEAERERIAKQYRAEGEEESAKIIAETEREKTVILAEAYKEAQQLRGEGEAEAIRVYAESFNQDPEFYKFYRSLEAYLNSFNENTTILLSPDNEYIKYINDLSGN